MSQKKIVNKNKKNYKIKFRNYNIKYCKINNIMSLKMMSTQNKYILMIYSKNNI